MWPDDATLRNRFLDAPLYQWMTRARLGMILAAVEARLRTVQAETRAVPAGLQIEHIMPQGWPTHWPLALDDTATAERRNRLIHTIGNLTLVNGALNKTLSNAAWDKKQAALAGHSILFLNKDLVHDGPEVWDEAAIEDRTHWLHGQVVAIWPPYDVLRQHGPSRTKL